MSIELAAGGWDRLGGDATAVRHQVFVLEQGVPQELELDEEDIHALHVVAYAAGRAVATGRLLADGHIGRLAVLERFRGQGLGSHILANLLAHARAQALPRVVLNAQTQALAFYQHHGFIPFGPVFDDAGLPHRAMELKL